jgi:hypothetical protein
MRFYVHCCLLDGFNVMRDGWRWPSRFYPAINAIIEIYAAFGWRLPWTRFPAAASRRPAAAARWPPAAILRIIRKICTSYVKFTHHT